MGKVRDLTGQKFNRLLVIRRAADKIQPNGDKRVMWECLCDCGKTVNVASYALTSGNTKSCGCLNLEAIHNRRYKDLTGQKFGYLTCIEPVKIRNGVYKWLCECVCGNRKIIDRYSIVSGKTRSCGCMTSQLKCETRTISGDESWKNRTYDRLYRVWQGMKARCYNPNNKDYPNYGGRGIKVCEEWEHNYPTFKEWAYKNGYDDNAHFLKCTLDRVDYNGNYSPTNCRWVYDFKEQNANKSNNVYITYNGETRSPKEWAKITGLSENCIIQRRCHGWTDEEIISIPHKHYRSTYSKEEKFS